MQEKEKKYLDLSEGYKIAAQNDMGNNITNSSLQKYRRS